MTPLEWAHKFADAGIRVHPVWWTETVTDDDGNEVDEWCACAEGEACKSAGKHPIVSTSQSTMNHQPLDEWWRHYPYANLGVNTAGLTVVDVDYRSGGLESYKLLQPDLPATFRVRTGNGFHEYYTGEVGKAGGQLARGIDFKSGPSQQVVGPGSTHASGAEYEVMNDAPRAALPTRVLEMAGRRAEPSDERMGAHEPFTGEKIPVGEGNAALVAAAAFFANHSRTEEELIGHVRAVAWASMDQPATDERVREIAHHRWLHHDHRFVDPAIGAILAHVDEAGNYVFDSGDELDAILAGTYEPPRATILQLPDGRGLFYPASINLVFGEDSIGKTWVSLSAAQFVLARGGTVVHLDWDDSYATCAYRLHLLGASGPELRDRYRHKTSPGDIRGTAGAILATGAQLIVVDVVANALAAADLNEDKAGDYLKWAADTAIAWARAGACVILNDHVTKGQGDHSYARGSGAKRGGVDGVAYEVKAVDQMLPGQGGRLRLRIQKDRHGSIGGRNVDVADLAYSSDMTLDVVDPPEPEGALDYAAVMAYSIRGGQCEDTFTRRDFQDLTGAGESVATRIIRHLTDNGVVRMNGVPGSRNVTYTWGRDATGILLSTTRGAG